MFNVKRSFFLALPVVAWIQPYRPMVVIGESMAPTYANHSILLTQPIDRPLKRGDVVVVDSPQGPLVKRIVLLPGDHRYQWDGGGGWYDLVGVAIPGKHRRYKKLRSIPVPVGTVFVLGDNIRASTDSRNFGPVETEKIVRLVVDQREPETFSPGERELANAWIVMAQSRKHRKSVMTAG